MNRNRWVGWERLLVLAVAMAVTGCAAAPAGIPALAGAADTPGPSATATAEAPTVETTEAPEPTATTAASGRRLRLTNSGSTDILKLVVVFPGGRVAFGDLATGQTSAYREIPGGVYGYAAYEFEVDGQTVQQPVIDWVGEVPLEGAAFTYTIQLTAIQSRCNWIELVSVTRDE